MKRRLLQGMVLSARVCVPDHKLKVSGLGLKMGFLKLKAVHVWLRLKVMPRQFVPMFSKWNNLDCLALFLEWLEALVWSAVGITRISFATFLLRDFFERNPLTLLRPGHTTTSLSADQIIRFSQAVGLEVALASYGMMEDVLLNANVGKSIDA